MSAIPTREPLVATLVVRGLGLAFLIAFASLGVQVAGLLGIHGIAPATEWLAAVAAAHGGATLRVPSWLWLTGASDAVLQGMCLAGSCCSLLVMLDMGARVWLLVAWSLYLSLCAVGRPFLSYQWDALLLESGLVGWCVAIPGSRLGLVLARALCLKLMLLSGLVKLMSGDPAWRSLSALSYHFWTQPLPAWPAVPMSELPDAVLSAMTFATLAVELIAPLAIFGPRRARLAAAAALALLQLMIAATGNYGFFNLLSLVLCASLLDDAALLALTPRRLRSALQRSAATAELRAARAARDSSVPLAGEPRWQRARERSSQAWRALQRALALGLLSASVIVGLDAVLPLPAAVTSLVAPLQPLGSINSYGLFAMMTTERREIALEGSRDGSRWRRYRFRWKPDALDQRPRFIGPHMPRLDWQMWFAALSQCGRHSWFPAFLQRVLQGEPSVLGLLEHNPFPREPPRYLRTPVASYHFAPASRWLHGQWWVREPRHDYCPPVTLHASQLSVARELVTGPK